MNNIICNVDTDSIMIAKPDGSPWSKEEQDTFLEALNAQFPEKINWEHDGIFPAVVIIKSKNYAMQKENGKVILKGSSIKTSSKEVAMKEMMTKIIQVLLETD